MDKTDSKLKIWNPLHAVFWSFLLTPVFGAFIHMKNWESFNNEKKTKSATNWFAGSLASVAMLFIDREAGTGFVSMFFLLWIFIPAREQIKYFKNLEPKPESNEWVKPICTTFGIFFVVALLSESGIIPSQSAYKLNKHDRSIVSQIVNMSPIDASNKGFFLSDRTVIGWKGDNFGENHQCILMIRAHLNEKVNEFANRKWDLSVSEHDGVMVIGFADALGNNQRTARLIVGKEQFEAVRTNGYFMLEATRKILKMMATERTAEAYYGQPTGHRISNDYLLTDFERGMAIRKEVCKQLR